VPSMSPLLANRMLQDLRPATPTAMNVQRNDTIKSSMSLETVPAVNEQELFEERNGMPRPEDIYLGDEEEGDTDDEDDDILWSNALARKSSLIICSATSANAFEASVYIDERTRHSPSSSDRSVGISHRGPDFGRGLFSDSEAPNTPTEPFPACPPTLPSRTRLPYNIIRSPQPNRPLPVPSKSQLRSNNKSPAPDH